MNAEFIHLLLDRIEELECRIAKLEEISGRETHMLDAIKAERAQREAMRKRERDEIRARVEGGQWRQDVHDSWF